MKNDISFVAESVMSVLGEYLHYISSIRDKLPGDVREEARIGADVIAASIQYSSAARDGLDKSPDEVRPLPVFAMVRSAIYGLIFLENIDLVRTKSDLPSAGRFVRAATRRWDSDKLASNFGSFDSDKDHHDRWSELSQYVHIIPAIKKEGGISYKVDFDSPWDSSRRSRHAGLPENFGTEALACLEWQARLSISTMVGFRRKFSRLFEFNSDKVRSHVEGTAFPMCTKSVLAIPADATYSTGMEMMARHLFSRS